MTDVSWNIDGGNLPHPSCSIVDADRTGVATALPVMGRLLRRRQVVDVPLDDENAARFRRFNHNLRPIPWLAALAGISAATVVTAVILRSGQLILVPASVMLLVDAALAWRLFAAFAVKPPQYPTARGGTVTLSGVDPRAAAAWKAVAGDKIVVRG
jgi:hypothetical protein